MQTLYPSAAENNFIFNQLRGSGYSPWIGLYNTGKPGQFGWVNGEAFGYANWAPNEPNNAHGNTRTVKEPYVRFIESYGTWNDQRSDNVPFIAEFEEPLIRYRQISGPAMAVRSVRASTGFAMKKPTISQTKQTPAASALL